jgi:hypothetical protein
VFVIDKYSSIISTMPSTANNGTKPGGVWGGASVCDERAGLQWSIDSIPGGHQESCPRLVRSIGSHALFLGRYRCISIDSSKVPTVQAVSIYYADLSHIRSYDCEALAWEEEATLVGGYGVSSLWDNHSPFALD